jgi:hypothetical protein
MALALAIVLSFGSGGVQKESSLDPCWTLVRWVAENCRHLDRTLSYIVNEKFMSIESEVWGFVILAS